MEKHENENETMQVMETTAEYLSARDEVTFRILEHIGTLRTSATGWSREMNIVAWNGGKPKFDIRDWSEDHTKMSKGITMTDNEMKRIYEWISARGTVIPSQAPEGELPADALPEAEAGL